MVYDDEGRILVQDRRSPDWPGLTFPGGHVDPEESFVKSVIREVFEETGLTISEPILCGTKQFQDLEGARYVVLCYKTNKFSGNLKSSDEGDVFWIHKSELNEFTLADDFEHMFRLFDSDTVSEFYYYKENDEWNKKLL